MNTTPSQMDPYYAFSIIDELIDKGLAKGMFGGVHHAATVSSALIEIHKVIQEHAQAKKQVAQLQVEVTKLLGTMNEVLYMAQTSVRQLANSRQEQKYELKEYTMMPKQQEKVCTGQMNTGPGHDVQNDYTKSAGGMTESLDKLESMRDVVMDPHPSSYPGNMTSQERDAINEGLKEVSPNTSNHLKPYDDGQTKGKIPYDDSVGVKGNGHIGG